MQKTELLNLAIKAAKAAGAEILRYYYQNDFEVKTKGDNSPLTSADISANEAIFFYLSTTPYEICSEENILSPDKMTANDTFWLIDPLDGTKNFLKKNGEFCVCIALIQNSRPILGVIYAPVSGELFYIDALSQPYFNGNLIKTQSPNNIICANKRGIEKVEKIAQNFNLNLTNCGSAIKFCRMAQGQIDVYPRFIGSSLWDLAAGDAILKASGGEIFGIKSGKELTYTGKSLENEYFIALNKNFINKKDEILDFTRKLLD